MSGVISIWLLCSIKLKVIKKLRGPIPGRVIPKTQKMVLNTQHYKIWIKGKVEQSWEWSSTLPHTSVW